MRVLDVSGWAFVPGIVAFVLAVLAGCGLLFWAIWLLYKSNKRK